MPSNRNILSSALQNRQAIPLDREEKEELLDRLRVVAGQIHRIQCLSQQGAPCALLLSEVNLLEHLLHADHVHDPEETITPLVDPNALTTAPSSCVESVLPAFERWKVVVVTKEGRPVGILTKIDLIGYLAEKIG